MKTDLVSFVCGMNVPGVPASPAADDHERLFPRVHFGAHHILWLSLLQRVEEGELKRLMGLMPPGSAKSTYTSVVFPAHVMGRFKETQVLLASYGSRLPKRWGRR